MSNVPPAGGKKRRKETRKVKEIVVPDEPRFLHRNPGMGKNDYTDNPAMTDARELPEPVTGDALKDIQDRARANFNVLHAEQEAKREVKSLKARLSETEARARKQGVDATPTLMRIRAEIADLEARLDQAA